MRTPVATSACLALALLLGCQNNPATAFAPAAVPQLRISCGRRRGRVITSSPVTSTSRATVLSPPTSILGHAAQETSSELLHLLQGKTANTESDGVLDNRINMLVRTLVASKETFDPAKSIDGPLFASVHFIGDTPLWENLGSLVGVRNVKGQKYTLDGGSSGTLVNYAEIFGKHLYLKAVGRCKDEGPVSSPAQSVTADEKSSSNSPLAALKSLFKSGDDKNNEKSALLPTPYDYSAAVTGASIVLFERFSLDLSIEGTGTVRVLYADNNLRIFLSPTDTNVTRGGGDWESEGLIVVQVRVDLIHDDWTGQL